MTNSSSGLRLLRHSAFSRCAAVLLLCLAASEAFGYSLNAQLSRAMLKDLSFDAQGYFTNTSRNAYFILDELDLTRQQACILALKLNFKTSLASPATFDVYWRTASEDFSEVNKAFFIVDQVDSQRPNTYPMQLCKLHNFTGSTSPSAFENITGLRFDYPVNKTISVKFASIEVFDAQAFKQQQLVQDHVLLELYERIPASSIKSWRVVYVKLSNALREAGSRVLEDWRFLLVWLSVLLALTFLIIRGYVTDKPEPQK